MTNTGPSSCQRKLAMRLSSDLPPSTPPLSLGLKPKITRAKTAPKPPSPEDQANALHNNMAGPHPDATHAIYPDRGSPTPSLRDASRRREARTQSFEADGGRDDGPTYSSWPSSPDHAVQSGRTERVRDRYYGRDKRDKRKRERVEEQTGQQSRQAGATAVQMGVGGVPEAVSISTAGMPTMAEGSKCVIL